MDVVKKIFASLFIAAIGLVGGTAQTLSATPQILPARAVVMYAPKPQYPESARKHGIGGAGVFVLHVDRTSGLVSSVSVQKSMGAPVLDQAAIDAFRKWRFKPNTLGPKVVIPLTFVPDNSPDKRT